MIRAAVIGLGRWGRNHVRSVQGGDDPPSPHVRFVRAVVQTPERSADFAREHGLALGTDLRSVLADPSIDAVVLATPNSQHAGQVRAVDQVVLDRQVLVEEFGPVRIVGLDAAHLGRRQHHHTHRHSAGPQPYALAYFHGVDRLNDI